MTATDNRRPLTVVQDGDSRHYRVERNRTADVDEPDSVQPARYGSLVDDEPDDVQPARYGSLVDDEPDELDAGEAADRGPLAHLIIGGLGIGIAGVFIVSNVLALPFWLVAGGAVAATGAGAAVAHSAKTTRRHGRRTRPARPPRPAKLGGAAGGRPGGGLPKLGLPKLGGSSGRKSTGGPKLGGSSGRRGGGLPKLGTSRGGAGSKSKAGKGPAAGGSKSTGLKMPRLGRAGAGKGAGLLDRKGKTGAGSTTGRKGSGLKLPTFGGKGRASSADKAKAAKTKIDKTKAAKTKTDKTRRATRAAGQPLTPGRVARLRAAAQGRRQARAAGVNVSPTRAARRNARATRIAQRLANRAQRRTTRSAKLRAAARATRATMLTKPATWVGRKMISGTRAHWRAKAADIWAGQRQWMRVQRIMARRRAAATWAAIVRRYTPTWARNLRELARTNGKRAAFAAAFVGAAVALAGFLRSSLWAEPQPRHAATPTPGALPPRATHRPRGLPPVRPATTSTATRPPATTTPRPAAPPAAPDPTPAPAVAAAGYTTGVPAVHEAHSRMLEVTNAFTAGYQPRSIPDLEGYLRSQPAAFRARGEHIGTLADRLAAQFPGAVLVHSFYREFAHGYAGLSDTAVGLHSAYRALHAADLARHEQPRVNEHLADLNPNGGGSGIPTIGDGTVMHEHHARIVEASRNWVAQWFPGRTQGVDPVQDLLVYLQDQPEVLFAEAGHVKALADRLVAHYPVEADLHQYYYNFAGGLARLADQARQLEDHYRTANAHDIRRREQPRTNESWADVSNR